MQGDDYQEGEAEAEHISWLIGHALKGHRGHTEDLWRVLAADTSDCTDEGRWLRSVARWVEAQILDAGSLPIEDRGKRALEALGLRDRDDPNWSLKQEIEDLSMFDDLVDGAVSRTPMDIVRAMRDRGHFRGVNDRNAAKIVSRILRAPQK